MPNRTFKLAAFALVTLVISSVSFAVLAQDVDKADKKGDKEEAPVATLKKNEVARVNNRVISAEEFIQRLVLREKVIIDPDQRTAQWALDSLIIEELLNLEANRLAAVAKRRWTDEEYKALLDEWEATFKRINAAVTDEQKRNGKEAKPYSREEFVQLKYDMTWPQFTGYLQSVARENVIRRQVVNYWKLTTDSANAEGLYMRSEDEIKKVRERLVAGEKLGPIAGAESENMHTRQSGGIIGMAYKGDGSFEPEVDEAFWKLDKEVWSEPIKTQFGYWLVRKAKFFPGNEAPFFQLQEKCLEMPTVDDKLLLKWRHAVASSGRYAFERRMPGWDCMAGED